MALERVKRNNYRGGQEIRTGVTNPLRTGRDQARGRGRRGGFNKWRRKDLTKKGEPTGVDRGTSNVEGRERGATGRGQDSISGLVAWVYIVRQVPGEKVKGGKTASAGRTVEAGRIEACFARRSNTGTRVGNQVRRTVQISLMVEYERGDQ